MTHPLHRDLLPLTPLARLRLIRARVPGKLVFTTSLGLEDQVLTHLLAESGIEVELATLDTGRLFPETYELWQQTEARYGLRIRAYVPDQSGLEALVATQGINGFYDSVQARQACCHLRKVAPLGRALAGAAGWITGLRADQSAARSDTPLAADDPTYGLIKFNPLLDWTRAQTLAFANEQGVPINPLHARGFVSIGCAPCTRAIQPGEPERAGRWWWEDDSKKECGLHVGPDGRLTRLKSSNEATS